jgi:hypothetical protein
MNVDKSTRRIYKEIRRQHIHLWFSSKKRNCMTEIATICTMNDTTEAATTKYLVGTERILQPRLHNYSYEEQKPGNSRITNDQEKKHKIRKKGIITAVSLHAKLFKSNLYVTLQSFPSRSLCPRLEVQNSKLAKELGHLV